MSLRATRGNPALTPVTFTATTTWVVPANVYMVFSDLVGSGGGGGGGHDTATTGGGGGGGGSGVCYIGYPYPVTPGDTLTLTVGTGGAGGAGGASPAAGSNGNTSSVAGSSVSGVGTLKAVGGRGGAAGSSSAGGAGGSVGVANQSLLWAAVGPAAGLVGVFNTSSKLAAYTGIMQSGGGGGHQSQAAGPQADTWGDFIATGVSNGGGPGGCNQLGNVTSHTGGAAGANASALPATAYGFGGGGGGGTGAGGNGAAGKDGLIRLWYFAQ
jgi:hypothetical protein